MKKRYNISIEYGIWLEASKTINNMSRFLEKCLQNYLIYSKDKKPKNIIFEEVSKEEQERIKKQIEIADYKIWED